MFKLRFKVIVMMAFFVLTGISCSLNAWSYRHLKIVNNTDGEITVEIWLKGIAYTLKPDGFTELMIRAGNSFDLDTPFGVAYIDEVNEDTTLEINEKEFYVGEESFHYWNERE